MERVHQLLQGAPGVSSGNAWSQSGGFLSVKVPRNASSKVPYSQTTPPSSHFQMVIFENKLDFPRMLVVGFRKQGQCCIQWLLVHLVSQWEMIQCRHSH